MKIYVTAKPNAKEDKIKKIDDNHFIISTTELPIKGRANMGIIKILSEYFNVNKSNISILSGYKFKNKIFEIL